MPRAQDTHTRHLRHPQHRPGRGGGLAALLTGPPGRGPRGNAPRVTCQTVSRVTCQVILTPGDLVWYESARVVHGRQFPLRGGSFDNLFLHFKPLVWYR